MDPNSILIRLQPHKSSGDISETTLTSIVSQFGAVLGIKVLDGWPERYFLVEFEQIQSCTDALEFLDGFVENVGWITTLPAEFSSKIHSAKSNPDGLLSIRSISPLESDISPSQKRISLPYQIINYCNQDYPSPDASERSLPSNRSPQSEKCCVNMTGSEGGQRCGASISVLKTEVEVNDTGREECKKPLATSTEMSTRPSLALPGVSERSCFVQIHNLNPRILNPKVVMNLACCFGNAMRVYINSICAMAVIQYRNSKDADRAMIYLQGHLFFDSNLKLTNVMPEDINSGTFASMNPKLKSFDCKSPDFRYKNSLKVKFNAPSPVLHLTNLSENCTPQILFQILQSIHEPIRIFKLAKKSKNSTNMMLVEFRTVEESREVLTILHNKIIDHKSIRISFSHTKLD